MQTLFLSPSFDHSWRLWDLEQLKEVLHQVSCAFCKLMFFILTDCNLPMSVCYSSKQFSKLSIVDQSLWLESRFS